MPPDAVRAWVTRICSSGLHFLVGLMWGADRGRPVWVEERGAGYEIQWWTRVCLSLQVSHLHSAPAHRRPRTSGGVKGRRRAPLQVPVGVLVGVRGSIQEAVVLVPRRVEVLVHALGALQSRGCMHA